MRVRGRGGISLPLLLLPSLLLSTWLPTRLCDYPWVGRLSLPLLLLAPRAA